MTKTKTQIKMEHRTNELQNKIHSTGITQILTRKCWIGALALPQGRDKK
jgi:hypothetical protein